MVECYFDKILVIGSIPIALIIMMLLLPKKPKWTKSYSNKKIVKKTVNCKPKTLFSSLCLITSESGKITNFQLESLRKCLRRALKKKVQIFFRVFPNIPITKKSKNVRLGRGKGNVSYWTAIVKQNDIIVELRGFNNTFGSKTLQFAKKKLAVKTYTLERKIWWVS